MKNDDRPKACGKYFLIFVYTFVGWANSGWSSGHPAIQITEIAFRGESNGSTIVDRDNDCIDDLVENKIGEAFKPYFVFDSRENAKLALEPVVIFKVTPLGDPTIACRGVPRSIEIKFAYLFRNDGGYGSSSLCRDAHHGDDQSIFMRTDIRLLDMQGAKEFQLMAILNGNTRWLGASRLGFSTVQFYNERHAMIFLSAGKHHAYFDTLYNGRDSLYSEWGCNDDIGGRGARVFADLGTEPGIGQGAHNVGEASSHSPEFFLSDLSRFGFQGETAWGTRPFCGGYHDGCLSNGSIASIWQATWNAQGEF